MSDEIIGFNREGAEQYKKIAREVARQMQNETPHRARWQQNGGGGSVRVVIIGSLTAPATSDATPTSGNAAVLKRNKSNGKLEVTTKRIAFKNADASLTATDGTYAKIELIDGIWDCYWVACSATTAWMGL